MERQIVYEVYGEDTLDTEDLDVISDEEDEDNSLDDFVVSDSVIEHVTEEPVVAKVDLQAGLQTREENGKSVRRSTRARRGVKRYLDSDYAKLMLADVPESEQHAVFEDSDGDVPAAAADSEDSEIVPEPEEESDKDSEDDEEEESEDVLSTAAPE